MNLLERNTLGVARGRSPDGHRLCFTDVVPFCLLDSESLADDRTVACCVLQARDLVATFGGVEGGGQHPQRRSRIALQKGADLLALTEKRFHDRQNSIGFFFVVFWGAGGLRVWR